jgi:hypothetical protein
MDSSWTIHESNHPLRCWPAPKRIPWHLQFHAALNFTCYSDTWPNITRVIKSRWSVCAGRSTHGIYAKYVYNFIQETWREETAWNTGVDGRKILKWVLTEMRCGEVAGFIWLLISAQWRDLVNRVMNIQIPYKSSNFTKRLPTINYSRKYVS